jgi:peptidyl-prolyl cis-trans isomerase SurA
MLNRRLVFLLLLGMSCRAAELVDGVAAIVNDKVITYSDVRDYVQPVVNQLRRNHSGQELIEKIRSAQSDALNNLIERALIVQEFKDKGYSIPETVITGQLNDVIATDYSGDRAAFIRTLQAQNMTLSQYRDQLRDRVIVQAMRNRKTQNEVVASPYKIEKYYHGHLDDYKVGNQIKLRMIFIKKSLKPADSEVRAESARRDGDFSIAAQGSEEPTNNIDCETNIVEQAAPPVDPQKLLGEEIVSKLDAGDSFESMAQVYSEGREAKQGGDWGWIGQDVLRKDLSEVAFALKPREHSKLVETEDGYYILYVEDVKPAHVKPLAEVRDEVEKILLQEQRAEMQDKWVKALRAKAYIRLF